MPYSWACIGRYFTSSKVSSKAFFPCPSRVTIGLFTTDRAVGFCLTLLLAQKESTKETLIHGIGLRFAMANWIQAAWAVCFVSPSVAA